MTGSVSTASARAPVLPTACSVSTRLTPTPTTFCNLAQKSRVFSVIAYRVRSEHSRSPIPDKRLIRPGFNCGVPNVQPVGQLQSSAGMRIRAIAVQRSGVQSEMAFWKILTCTPPPPPPPPCRPPPDPPPPTSSTSMTTPPVSWRLPGRRKVWMRYVVAPIVLVVTSPPDGAPGGMHQASMQSKRITTMPLPPLAPHEFSSELYDPEPLCPDPPPPPPVPGPPMPPQELRHSQSISSLFPPTLSAFPPPAASGPLPLED